MSWVIIVIAVCVVFEGFFSGSEIALVNANRLALKAKAEQGHLGAKIALQFLENPERLLGTTLVGTNLSTVTMTMVATVFMVNTFGDMGEALAIVTIWPITLMIGEIFPKTFYQANADRIAPVASFGLRLFYIALLPVVWTFTRISNLLIDLLRTRGNPEPTITRSDVKAIARTQENGSDIRVEEMRIISRLVDFSAARVGDAMRPLIDVIGIDFSMTAGEAARFAIEYNYSRFPVYKDRIDQIIGVIDTYTLLNLEDDEESLRRYMSKPLFVPESMPIKSLLAELRSKGMHMAIVVDEYGGNTGVITTEDLLEEIIGEIQDEFDPVEAFFKKVGPSSYVFPARAEIDQINERLHWDIPEGDYETLGGYLLHCFERIPKNGETYKQGNLVFTVLDPTNRTLTNIRVDVLPEE